MKDILQPISREGKIMMLAYDQGMEHGTADFNDLNWNPNYILDIALQGNFTCVTLQYGIALKFWKNRYEKVPLVVKLNGKTSLGKKAYSVANTSVEMAHKLGAKAVGYTIYIGSEHEADMFWEFGNIRDEAHSRGMAVLAWMYPFLTPPSSNDDEREPDIVAYAARAGAELGADVVKIKYPHQPLEPTELPWIIQNAVGTKAIISGGDKMPDLEFLENIQLFMDAGGAGVAIGRNVWQNKEPLELSAKIAGVVFG